MNVTIDWLAFLDVLIAALAGAAIVVFFYALGLRLLVRAGRAPVVSPAAFTDAITVISAKEAEKAQKRAAKASKKSPLTYTQKKIALWAAYACFGLCGAALLSGILIIIFKNTLFPH